MPTEPRKTSTGDTGERIARQHKPIPVHPDDADRPGVCSCDRWPTLHWRGPNCPPDTPSHERVPVEAERAVLRKWAEEAARRREYDANPEAYIWDLEDENYELAAALQALTLEREELREALGLLEPYTRGLPNDVQQVFRAALARNSEGEHA